MTADYLEGIKKDVAEIKFLIHDLRVERFINEIIHFHVTVNTDLEIYGIEQAQILHGEDLQALKEKAVSLRQAFREYSNAVRNFSPDATVLHAGNQYVEKIYGICELILNPHWGRSDKVLAFLPPESRSVRSRDSYRNSVRWLTGVSRRIKHFIEEQQEQEIYEEFGIGDEIANFTDDVILGYVNEKGGPSVNLQLDQLDPATVGGNRYRFRRMYFNLVMNSVDAVANRKVGVITVSDIVEGERVVLRVRDNGAGMSREKIEQLQKERETLDGELHSLGFVFVRQTVGEFGGELSIESEEGEGTTVSISFPRLADRKEASRQLAIPGASGRLPSLVGDRRETSISSSETREKRSAARSDSFIATRWGGSTAAVKPAAAGDRDAACGQMVLQDYQECKAQYPGSIFGIALTEEGRIEFFSHRPYDRYTNITHEDLSPMCYQATVRGRLEKDSLGRPLLTLKEPQSVREYFEFKNVPERERSPERHVQMVHDEYIRIARKLIATGLPDDIQVELTGLSKFFPEHPELSGDETFPLELLARQALSTETGR